MATAKNRADLKTESDSSFPSGTGGIKALDHRAYNDNQSASAINIVDTDDQDVSSSLMVKKQLTVQGGVIPFAAAATFDMDNGNEQEMLVTSNMTSLKITNKKSPASYGIYLVQDADGGNTIPDPDSTFGTKTTNSADFTTAPNARNIIDIRVFPSGLTQYSIETVEP